MKLAGRAFLSRPFASFYSTRHFISFSFIFGVFFSFGCDARLVEVVFLRWRHPVTQELILLDGQRRLGFSHLAIRLDEGWLHSYPGRGVELISWDRLLQFGTEPHILQKDIQEEHEFSEALLRRQLGKLYDLEFTWGNDAYYCSELAAVAFHIQPEPMQFGGEYWKKFFKQMEKSPPRGQPGVSPDMIYEELQNRGFRSILGKSNGDPCRSAL